MIFFTVSQLYDKSISDDFWSQVVLYSKYLKCSACKESGLYCKKHRKEVENDLRKQTIRKILKINNIQSERYKHMIQGLLESYDVWKINL